MNLLKHIWEGWKKVAHRIGDFQARLILALFYFVILGPISLLVRQSDPLHIRKKMHRGWLPKTPATGDAMERALQQS